MRFLILLISILFAQVSSNEIQTARILKQMNALQKAIDRYDGTEESLRELARYLTKGTNRLTMFNIQALGQIYENYPVEDADDFFGNTLRFEAKALEDAIGGVDKWDALLENLQGSGNTKKIEEAEYNLELAEDLLAYVLTGEKSTRLQNEKDLTSEAKKQLKKIEKVKNNSMYPNLFWVGTEPSLSEQLFADIENYPWLSAEDDRKYVIEELRGRLKKLQETKFDFGILEDEDEKKGLHEFRREVRWFAIQVQNLNGTVNYFDTFQVNPPICPSEDLAELPPVNMKYATISKSPFPQEEVCGISRCLFYKLTDVVAKVGDIKDEVEDLNFKEDLHNQTPKEYKDAVEAIYKSVNDTEVLKHLRKELKNCIEK